MQRKVKCEVYKTGEEKGMVSFIFTYEPAVAFVAIKFGKII